MTTPDPVEHGWQRVDAWRKRRQRLAGEIEEVDPTVASYQKLIDRLAQSEDKHPGKLDAQLQRRYAVYAELKKESVYDVPPSDEEAESKHAPVDDWAEEGAQDRRHNVLYQLWVFQLLQRQSASQGFDEFNEVVAGRAVVRLLHHTPNGSQLIAGLYEPGEDAKPPNRDDIRRFVTSGGLEEQDPQRFLARLFAEVPGSHTALYRILSAYKQVVLRQWEQDEIDAREERYSLPGGDYPTLPPEVVTWDQLAAVLGVAEPDLAQQADLDLERAVTHVVGGGTVSEAAQRYGIGEKRLRSTLRERGFQVRRGRPRKGEQ